MLLDIIALLIVLFAVFKGLRNGLIVAVFSLLAVVIGLAAALKLSEAVAAYIGQNVEVSQRWLPFVAFLLVFLLVLLLVRLGARLLQSAVQAVMLGWANRLGGVVFYAFLYFFVFSTLLFYAVQLSLIKPQTLASSVSYPSIAPLAPAVMNVLGAVFPFFKNMFQSLLDFFDAVGNQPRNTAATSF